MVPRNRRVADLEARLVHCQLSTLREQAEILNISFEPIFLWAFPTGEITFWNTGAEELYGFTKVEAVGRSVDDLLQTQYSVPAGEIHRELEGAQYWSGEVTYVSREGHEIVVESRLMLLQCGQESVVFEANRDLTERKNAEKSLHLAAAVGSHSRKLAARAELGRRQLAVMIENVSQAIVLLDSDGTIIAANPAFVHLHGFGSVEEMPSSAGGLAELIELTNSQGEAVSFSERPLQMALSGQTVLDREITMTNVSTGKRWVGAISATPIRDELGQVMQVVLSIHDLTERKEMENSLRHANADLEQFAYAAAHDLQEPARTVGLYSQLLAQQCGPLLDKEKNELLDSIVQGARRMQDLIRDLLAYSRAVEHHPDEELGTDVNEVFREVLDNLTSSIKKSGAQIKCGALPHVAARKAHVIQIFQNILTNALKYGGTPPVVDISAEQTGSDYLFTIQDNGAGIPPEYHERIFKVFTRLHGKQIPGTGIGLAICERIVAHYGGRISVKSELGQGAAFQFVLPGLPREYESANV